MTNCKDCICYESCKDWAEQYEDKEFPYRECRFFKSKADVVEVKHGYWIYHECVSSYEGAISGYSCSECSSFVDEEIFNADEFHKDFCGQCGAKMDGERKGE